MTRDSSTLLVGWDWEETAASALSWAADYARLIGGRILLVHVVVPLNVRGSELPALSRDQIEGLERSMRETAARHGVRADAEVVVAPSIGPALLELATRRAVSVVCVGHGRGGLSRLVLGSTALQLVRQSSVPVLVAPGAPVLLGP